MIEYLGKEYTIRPVLSIKINGIYLQQDLNRMVDINVQHALERIERQLKGWSRRRLTTLGKIMIVKTSELLLHSLSLYQQLCYSGPGYIVIKNFQI